MPLIQYLGNATPQDNTEIINLNPDPDTGAPRSIALGARALVSGDELRALAANYQIIVIEDGDEEDPSVIPTEMPSGYEDDGYTADDQPSNAVFGPDNYPDDVEADGQVVPDPSVVADVSAPVVPAPVTPVTPASAAPATTSPTVQPPSASTPASVPVTSSASSDDSSSSSPASTGA